MANPRLDLGKTEYLVGGLILMTLGIVWYLFFITLVGVFGFLASIVMQVIGFWFLLRLIVSCLVFPGSTKLWAITNEATFCEELSKKLAFCIRDIKNHLEGLDRNMGDIGVVYSMDNLKLTLKAYRSLENITKNQKALLLLLNECELALRDCDCLLNDRVVSNLWNYLSSEDQITCRIKTKDSSLLEKAITISQKIEDLLYDCYSPLPWMKSLRRTLTNDTIGTLAYMRAELTARFKGEQIWISTSDNTKIDCFYIPNGKESSIMIFCHANAGVYEFAYYQSVWIDYYIGIGVSLFLWNYRGYGRSTGYPSLDAMKKDAEYVVNYVRTVLHPNKIGTHGESLGGCIATHLAEVCSLDLLFADRSFSSLSDTILFSFGKIAYLGFKFSALSDSDSINCYLKTSCYKIVSADPTDEMIDDLASLKSGIALTVNSNITLKNLYENKIGSNDILTDGEMKNLVQIIKDIAVSYQNYIKDHQNLYEFSNVEAKDQEEDLILIMYLKVFMILKKVHSAKKNLVHLAKSSNPIPALYVWLLVLTTWRNSTFEPVDPERITRKLRSSISDINDFLAEYSHYSAPEIRKLALLLNKLKIYFEKLKFFFEAPRKQITESAGHLLPLQCGHSRPLANEELIVYHRHLEKSEFLN